MLTKATGEIKELSIRLQAVMANAGLYAAMYSAQKDSYG